MCAFFVNVRPIGPVKSGVDKVVGSHGGSPGSYQKMHLLLCIYLTSLVFSPREQRRVVLDTNNQPSMYALAGSFDCAALMFEIENNKTTATRKSIPHALQL
jgi:hypothetical protein